MIWLYFIRLKKIYKIRKLTIIRNIIFKQDILRYFFIVMKKRIKKFLLVRLWSRVFIIIFICCNKILPQFVVASATLAAVGRRCWRRCFFGCCGRKKSWQLLMLVFGFNFFLASVNAFHRSLHCSCYTLWFLFYAALLRLHFNTKIPNIQKKCRKKSFHGWLH